MNASARIRATLILAAAAIAVQTGHARALPFAACAELMHLASPGVTVTAATLVPSGPFTPTPNGRTTNVSAFCRVTAVAAPSSDSQINIEVWMPEGAAWNGKLLGTANGGFAGSIPYPAMTSAIARGYAAIGTDTGHTGDQVEFAQGHPEKVSDWAWRSVHVMTDVAKAAVRAFHGRGADRAYFDGCSTGGQQGLTEAQRFPADYDGIVAGDPGHNRVRLILGFLWGWLALHDNAGKPLLPAAKLPMITRAAVAACRTGADDVDNWIADPSSCRFDPATVACRGDDNESCLTPAEVDAVRKVYQGARNPRTGEQIFPGWARGTEQGWGSYLLNPPEPVRVGMMRSLGFDNPTWDFRTFDWDRDVARVDARMAPLAATSTDLRAFKARGGKLLMYTGLADPVAPPADTVGYVEAVTRTMGGRPETDAFLRFFPVPGMGHCMGGPGLTSFDALSALDAWVSGDAAPDQLVATRPDNVLPASSRPLCAYPSVARRRAGAPPDRAESYRCEPAR